MPSAFVLTYGDWYIVLGEHHNPVCYHKDDVEQIFEFQITKHQNQIKSVSSFRPKPRKTPKSRTLTFRD